MKDKRFRGNRRGKKPRSTTLVLIIVGAVAFLLLAVIGLYLLLRGPNFDPLGPMLALDLPNHRVTPENYAALKDGATSEEVEAILGKGRPARAEDIDALCGGEEQRYINPFFKDRDMWEENSRRGLVLVWTNGQARLLILFTKPPEQAGRLLNKVLIQEDGSILMLQGNPAAVLSPQPASSGFTHPQTIVPGNQPQSTAQEASLPNLAFDSLLEEFRRDEQSARKKYMRQRIKVTGTIFIRPETNGKTPRQATVILKTAEGKGQLHMSLDRAALSAMAAKKVGDSLCIVGTLNVYLPPVKRAPSSDPFGTVVFNGCTVVH